MKKSKHTLRERDSERGAIAILIAAMWTTLFGLAAFAVDVGYLYTRQRGIQSAADAAVVAGMPQLEAGNQSTARSRATDVANLNGYTSGDIVNIASTPTSLRVELRKQHPTFFASILGLSARTLTAQSEGRITTPAALVIHSNAGCGSTFGLTVTGNARLNVTGSVQSNGKMDLDTSLGGSISGQAKVACAGQPTWDPAYTAPTVSMTGPFADPLAGLTPANFAALCTSGSLGGSPTITPVCGAGPGGCDLIPSGIYCAAGNISVTTSCPGQNICAPNSTFVSATGQIQFGANNGITLGPHPNTLQNVVIITGNAGNPAVHLGSALRYSLTGTVYAPLGVIMCNGGDTGPNTVTGSVVGSEIFMAVAPNAVWNFSGGGPSGSGNWRLYQ